MDLETAANPADGEQTVVVAPQTEAQAPAVGETETPDTQAEGSDLEQLIANPNDEFEEVEVDGKKIKVSPDGKEYLLREADYRRKTMETADLRRSLEAEREQAKALVNRSQEEFQAAVLLTSLQGQIKQYEAIDWPTWMQSDPQGAQAARWEYDNLVRQHDQVNNALAQHMQQQAQTRSQETAKQRQAAIEAASREIPNFNDTRRTELENFAVKIGFPKELVDQITSPAEYKVLHLADVGQKFIESQRRKAQMARAQAGKPANEVGSGADAGKAPENMSMEEYKAWREAGNG